MQEKPKRKFNWGSALGWLIFILVIAGGPLFSLLRRALSGVVALPSNLLPFLIGGLVVLSIVISVARSILQASARRGDTRLPTGTPARTNAPMPPFGGPSASTRMPSAPQLPSPAALPGQVRRGTPNEARLPPKPRFEPIVNPAVLIIGLAGLALLGAAAVLVWGLSIP
jgi:hypothetical protein